MQKTEKKDKTKPAKQTAFFDTGETVYAQKRTYFLILSKKQKTENDVAKNKK